jgi:hypothetical protein
MPGLVALMTGAEARAAADAFRTALVHLRRGPAAHRRGAPRGLPDTRTRDMAQPADVRRPRDEHQPQLITIFRHTLADPYLDPTSVQIGESVRVPLLRKG